MIRSKPGFLVAVARSLIVITMRSERSQNLFKIVNRTIVISSVFCNVSIHFSTNSCQGSIDIITNTNRLKRTI